jgi:uncharacterized protein (DUF1697 family)
VISAVTSCLKPRLEMSKELEATIEEALKENLGFTSTTMVRSKTELIT